MFHDLVHFYPLFMNRERVDMVDDRCKLCLEVGMFWDDHLSFSEVARKIGTTRQNVYQRCLKGSIPCERDESGKPGVPMEWVEATLKMRSRDVS